MANARSQYRCSECRHVSAKWVGRCVDCGSWGTVDEVAVLAAVGNGKRSVPSGSRAVPISAVEPNSSRHQSTGMDELDRVLGGGVVPGSVTLLAGDPGVGKSTLLLEVAHCWAQPGTPRAVHLRRGVRRPGPAAGRPDRLRRRCLRRGLPCCRIRPAHGVGAHRNRAAGAGDRRLGADDVHHEADGVAGGVTQVRAVTAALTAAAKSNGVALILVGHVTKDGAIAGPRSLEHLVDVVLHFEGDRNGALRMVRGIKNRFGAADEVGCFLLHDNGIEGVADPSNLFLDQRPKPVPGTAITVTLDGKRPLIGEVQALLATPNGGSPRRAVSGIDHSRAAMITAVLEKHAGLTLAVNDIYLSTVGGMRLTDPSSDLAVAIALASAYNNLPLPTTAVMIGEVGLAGDLRRVHGMDRRLAEAARQGFTIALIPPGCKTIPAGLRALSAPTIGEALQHLLDIAEHRAAPELKFHRLDSSE